MEEIEQTDKRPVLTAVFTLFASAFTSATLLPGSSEVVLLALLAAEQGQAMVLLAVATVGNVSGSLVNWVLGRFFAHWRQARWFPVGAAEYARAEGWFQRYGSWLLLASWVPVVGDPLTVVAGAFRVGFWRFMVLVTLAKFGRYAVLVFGYLWWRG